MKLVAVLSDVRSVHNVGSIFRTADAAGVSKIYLCGITPSPLDRLKNVRQDFGKVALGAHEYIEWKKVETVKEAVDELKREGYRILAVEQSKGSIPYHEAVKSNDEKIALVMGNEVTGLPQTILDEADAIIEIPMHGKKESLNVAVAFGIVAFGVRQATI